MPHTAIKGSQLTSAAMKYSMTLGGLSLIPRFVDIDSVKVKDVGIGGVGSIEFELWDPLSLIGTITDGTEILFRDEDLDVINFRGYTDSSGPQPAFATGRKVTVSGASVNAWLDWAKVKPSFTPVAAQNLNLAISALARSLSAPLNSTTGSSDNGTLTQPVGELTLVVDGSNTIPFLDEQPVIDGASLREGIAMLATAASYHGVGDTNLPATLLVDVDYHLGLRVWPDDIAEQPDDYATLTVTDTIGGAVAASALKFDAEYLDLVHEVYVDGGNAAGSGWFGDGTGLRGRQEIITDDTCTTTARALQLAASYFAQHGQATRGTLTLSKYVPTANVRAGSLLALTDAPSGATGTWRIYSIDKTFNPGGSEEWSIAFGGPRPSAVNLLRKLTRGTSL